MNIKLKLILLELLSLLALSVILISGSLMLSVGEINVRVEETLRTAVFGFHGDTSYLREQGENIDITVFEGDTRTDSSIEGAVGTKASAQVIEQVLNKRDIYFDTDININGTDTTVTIFQRKLVCCLQASRKTPCQSLSKHLFCC